MKQNLNHEWIKQLVQQGKSYKEVVQITGFNKNSVYGWCLKHFGKLKDFQGSRRQAIPITQEQKEYIFGTMLGDGNLRLLGKHKNTVFGRTNHSLKQLSYCAHKQEILYNLTYSVKQHEVYNKDYNKIYQKCYFCFKPNTELLPFYYNFYGNHNIKDIPQDLSLLTPKALAWWFMDDGYASSGCSISIATCSFSLEGLLRLKDFLKKTYDLNIEIQKDFKIYFHKESAIKFYNLTKDYIIKDMLYKFKFIL